MQSVAKHSFARGVRGHAPPKILKNGAIWSVLECILLQFCKKNHFYIKIKDIVLLRTIFRGILEHTPQNVCLLCNLVRFGLHFLKQIYMNI